MLVKQKLWVRFRQTELCVLCAQAAVQTLQWRRPLTCALQPACQLVGTDEAVQLGVIVGLIPAVLEILPVEVGEVHDTLPVVDAAEADDARRRRTLEQVCGGTVDRETVGRLGRSTTSTPVRWMNGKLLGLTQQQVGEKEWAKVVGGKCRIQPIFGYQLGKTWARRGNTFEFSFYSALA